jgi:hypothetical protein
VDVNGDGPLSVFGLELIADGVLESVTPRLLENNDALLWNGTHLTFEGRVTTGIDGLDFELSPGARALLAVSKNGVANPRQLHIGSTGGPLTPAGWMLEADTLPALPGYRSGVDLGLFVGRAGGEVRARWNGDGPRHRSELEFWFSQAPAGVTPVSFEANDALEVTARRAAVDAVVTTGWDGLNLSLVPGTRLGLAYRQDGLVQPHRVNPADRNLGLPNAYWLPRAEPYGDPGYDAGTDRGLFVWKDQASGVWHVRGTGGGGFQRYIGEVVSDQPLDSVTPVGLESNDVLDTSDPLRVAFDLRMVSPWDDGFDLQVPAGAHVELNVQSVSTGNAVQAMRIGAERWPVQQLPVDLSGW